MATSEPNAASGTACDNVAIAFSGVCKAFDQKPVLDDISFVVAPGEKVAIVGPSGGGKSTLLSITCGLLDPDGGTVSVEGESRKESRLKGCALMPQRDLLLPWRSALDNACIALENKGLRRSEARRQTAPLFEEFGLSGYEKARPDQLSGGMRQRVSFVRTLMSGKSTLLLDEPFGALDSLTRGEMQSWLHRKLIKDQHTVILVTHDVEEALYLSDRVAVLTSRPARLSALIDVDLRKDGQRRDVITSPRFVELKERAMEALEQ